MGKGTKPVTESADKAVQALLDRHHCPVPWHAVRAHMLGAIASPVAGVSPITVVKGLWGGTLPTFAKPEDAVEFMNLLAMGLWNRLTKHQQRNSPFRLTPIKVPPTAAGLVRLAQLRRQELDGFIDGLYGQQASIDLPERAHQALNTLGDIRAMLAGLEKLSAAGRTDSSGGDISGLCKQMSELGKIVETEIHAAVLSCASARQQMQKARPAEKPALH